MRTLVAGLIFAMLSAPLACAGSVDPGAPGSDARRAWCKALYDQCVVTAKKPGFLGGPLNWCNDTSRSDCISMCQVKYGERSACQTAARPKAP